MFDRHGGAASPPRSSSGAAGNPLCPRCQQDAFEFEDVGEGEKLVCTLCGFLVDEQQLVHQAHFDEDGNVHAGVRVRTDDDGAAAASRLRAEGGAGAAPSAVAAAAARGRSDVLPRSRERLAAAATYLQLPSHVSAAAKQLLPLAVDAYGSAQPRCAVGPATVAAVIYLAAREQSYALSLGTAGAALSVYGVHVGREFRRLVSMLDMPMPPPNLQALVLRTAASVLPHYLPAAQPIGPLRQQPVVQRALDLAELLQLTSASTGLNPWLGAAAVLSMCLAENFRDAPPHAYAAQLAAHLGHDRKHVQQHIRSYEAQLAQLLPLLPFTSGDAGSVGVELARNAGILLKLQRLSRAAAAPDAAAGGGSSGAAPGRPGVAVGGGSSCG